MERLRQRWNDGPQARDLIIFAGCLPILVAFCGSMVTIVALVYLVAHR